jgi:ferredoxin
VTTSILSPTDLAAMVDGLIADGVRVIAPAAGGAGSGRTEYRTITRLDEAVLGGALPLRSLKEFFLPPTEVLLRYRQRKDGVDLKEVPTTFAPQVILAARPCDSAGVETMDEVMGWDYRDELWFGRRDATTIVSLACPGVDSTCFCAAVGIGPDSTKGADAQLVPLDPAIARTPSALASVLRKAVDAFLLDAEPYPGAADVPGTRQQPAFRGFLARALTPKGEKLLAGRGVPLSDTADLKVALEFVKGARERMQRNLISLGLAEEDDGSGVSQDDDVEAQLAAADGGHLMIPTPCVQAVEQTKLAKLPDWLAANYDHALWKTVSLRCHGCGACASVCSTCHCFDIVDEHDKLGIGTRRRNWDTCQSAKFTTHSLGHNPRATQTERFRQRVMHKFAIYPRRFKAISCTGCGRCARTCAAGTNLPEILGQLVKLAAPATNGGKA